MHATQLRMPRVARIVIPGVAHHVTQRGNRRQQTFYGPADYSAYLDLLSEGCREADIEILAWCLMPNHVHLVAVPQTTDGLRAALAPAHRSYTWILNRRNGWTGHLWQDRFTSCPMDDAHLVAAIRYAELNPVRAKLVASPQAWPWSSAKGHFAGTPDRLTRSGRPGILGHVTDWAAFLAAGLTDEEAHAIRAGERKCAVLGGPGFIARLEKLSGKTLHRRPRGRPRTKMGTVPFSP